VPGGAAGAWSNVRSAVGRDAWGEIWRRGGARGDLDASAAPFPGVPATNGDWPQPAREIIKAAGLPRELRANRSRLDDFDLSIDYRGSWIAPGFRGLGDFHETAHGAHNNGDSATMTFTGAGISVIGERNSDQGDIEVFIDDVSKGVISTAATSRQVQQTLYTTDDLDPATPHTVRVVKRSGQYATLDGFLVSPCSAGTRSSP
jgi:hypothetical protein